MTRTTSPVADDTRDWHAYVIGHGANKIVGRRPGSAENVRRAAEGLVVGLNERRSYTKGSKQVMLGSGRKP